METYLRLNLSRIKTADAHKFASYFIRTNWILSLLFVLNEQIRKIYLNLVQFTASNFESFGILLYSDSSLQIHVTSCVCIPYCLMMCQRTNPTYQDCVSVVKMNGVSIEIWNCMVAPRCIVRQFLSIFISIILYIWVIDECTEYSNIIIYFCKHCAIARMKIRFLFDFFF